jgi:HAMP domain-containing protein
MKYLLTVLISTGIACAFLALLFLTAERDATVTLAVLTASEQKTTGNPRDLESVQAVTDSNFSLAAVDIDVIFYGVIGLCGALLALRVVVLMIRTRNEERVLARRQLSQSHGSIAHPTLLRAESKTAPVLVPVVTRSKIEKHSPQSMVARRVATGIRNQLAYFMHGLTGKMIFIFSGIVAAFGLITMAVVYFTLSSSLNKHVMQRVRVVALNISDGASGYLHRNNAAGLRELLRKHANQPELAYILVENRAGEIFAHSFAVLPEEIQGASLADQRKESQRTLRVGGAVVAEVSVPILEGRNGTVRVGIWRNPVNAEIREIMAPLLWMLTLTMCGGILAAILLAWRINRPILKLVAAAKAISSGDLDTPSPGITGASEFDELSRAVERMRSSVKAAMIRLSR